jgi:hypothetical protein
MTVPSVLSNYTEMLRTEINRAGLPSWRTLYKNAYAHVENLRTLIKRTPELDVACDEAIARCREYADEIRDRGPLFSLNDKASQQAYQLALSSVEKLEGQLHDATPNERARALGLAWI